jgi:hypothetical protein
MGTLVGLFDDIRDAQRAFDGLIANGFHRNELSLIANAEMQPLPRDLQPVAGDAETGIATPHRYTFPGVGRAYALGAITGMLATAGNSLLRALVDLDLHEGDAGLCAEAARRGGALLIVNADDEAAARVDAILAEHNRVYLDERARRWRQRGWTGFSEQEAPLSRRALEGERELDQSHLGAQPGRTYPQPGAGGGVWSGEAPHTQDDKAIEDHARAEWLETIEPESVGPEAGPPDPDAESPYQADFRNHFDTTYGGTAPFAEFEPAYRHGAFYAESAPHTGRDWSSVESDIREHWEQSHPGSWHRYVDAIRYGWECARGRGYRGPDRRSAPRDETRPPRS